MMKNRVLAKLMSGAVLVCFVLACGLMVTAGCQENGKACTGMCKQGKNCPPDCKKTCGSKEGKTCPPDCKKACCSKEGKACPPDCKKPCCAKGEKAGEKAPEAKTAKPVETKKNTATEK
ncbi:MAG: hypothetical protein V2A79_01120 [Planctomycetota bacterium]